MKKVLLVQDNPLLARLWKNTLEKSGFCVSIVNDGQKGIESLQKDLPDIILADSVMPDIDGFDFCKTVKSREGLKHIPQIILVSNFNLQSEIERAREIGIEDYWLKYEITPGIITHKIRRLLNIPIDSREASGDCIYDLPVLLLEAGIIAREQLSQAEVIGRAQNITVSEAILQMEVIPEKEREFIKELVYRSDYVDLDRFTPTKEALSLVPDYVAAQYKILPLVVRDNNLLVAMANPTDVMDIDYLSQITECTIHTSYAPEAKIEKAIMRAYAGKEFQEEAEKIKLEAEEKEKDSFIDGKALLEVIDERPVVEFVNSLIFKAIEEKASDIHIEPYDKGVLVRYRIDGILHDIEDLPQQLCKAIVARIKVMASLNVVEKRLPQDGRFALTMQKSSVDFRVSSIPVIYGEKIVIRILSTTDSPLDLEKLEMGSPYEENYRKIITRPHGMVLITGPTGSGKTTTLYATLRFLNSPEKNIISVEDPVEYSIKRVNQIQVNPKIGLEFANILRHVLRQDPNIIMVGEIRDLETAELSAQAALTGHLVLGTLHTNDAPGALVRLVDMGLPSFIVASTVEGIVAQRLMRRICPLCKAVIALSEEDRKRIPSNRSLDEISIYMGSGCSSCRNTGYKGRVAIFEHLTLTHKIKREIISRIDLDIITALAREEGLKTLREAAWEKVREGISTLQEMWRVTQEED